MHSRFIGLVLVVLAMVLGTACAPHKDSLILNTPNGHKKCDATRAGVECNINTERQYSDCMAMQTPEMGNSRADMYCRNVTSGNQLGGASPMGVPGAMPGRGGYVPPPSYGVISTPDYTPLGMVNAQNAGTGGYVFLPGGSATGAPASTTDQDVRDLGRATAAQHKAFCRQFPNDPICCEPKK